MEQLMDDLFSQNQSNSIDSYYSKDVISLSLSQKRLILRAIKVLGQACDRDISRHTNLSLSIIPDRRASLLKEGLIEMCGKYRCRETNKFVTYYKIKEGE